MLNDLLALLFMMKVCTNAISAAAHPLSLFSYSRPKMDGIKKRASLLAGPQIWPPKRGTDSLHG